MKVVICSREPECRKDIRCCIMQEDQEAQIEELSMADDLAGIQGMDMLFLEIRPGDPAGINAVKGLRNAGIQIPVIFVSDIQDHVFDAFDVGAFQYLLKPVDPDTLRYVYRKASRRIWRGKHCREKQLIINTKKMSYSLKQDQILYAENDRKKIVLHTEDENIVIYGTMQELNDRLGSIFFRCHRGYLVNLNHIKRFNGDHIQVDNGDCIYLARDKYNSFVKTYTAFILAD